MSELNEAQRHILDAVSAIKYGAVEVTIHDSRVVQIERSEKIRFDGKKHTTPVA